jgi:L-ascorbate metabolism protein UlaG (beta-lactamase superfamily)
MNNKLKKMAKPIGFVIVLLLVAVGWIVWYVFDHMGENYSDSESDKKFGKLSYYNQQNHEFVSPEKLISAKEKTTGGNPGLLRFFKKSPYAPKTDLPKVLLAKKDFSILPSSFGVYWMGHSTALLELDGRRILVDPVFENAGPFPGITKRFGSSPIRREDLPKIDILLITHDHYDHLEAKTIKFLTDQDIRFVVLLGVGARLKGWGVHSDNITELGWWQNFNLGGIQITACPTIYYSGRSKTDKNKTLWASYAIKGKEKKIYWSGDTGYGKHFKEIGDKFGTFNVAFVEIDAWNNGWPKTIFFPSRLYKWLKM